MALLRPASCRICFADRPTLFMYAVATGMMIAEEGQPGLPGQALRGRIAIAVAEDLVECGRNVVDQRIEEGGNGRVDVTQEDQRRGDGCSGQILGFGENEEAGEVQIRDPAERERLRPGPEVLEELLQLLGVTLDDLGGDGQRDLMGHPVAALTLRGRTRR